MGPSDRRALVRTAGVTAAAGVLGGAAAAALGGESQHVLLAALVGGNVGLAAENRLRLAALGRANNRTASRLAAVEGLGTDVDGLRDELRRIRRDVRGGPEGARKATRADLDRVERRTSRTVDDQRRQLEAATQLSLLLRPDLPVPGSGGWAMSAEALALLVGITLTRRPRRLVECGSGTSSLWLGYALRRLGSGHLVSLEHDEEWAARSAQLVADHGLADHVEVRVAPLEAQPVGDGSRPWYARAAWQDLDAIDLLLVDGPPKATGPLARYPAVPLLLERLAPGAVVVLDDAARPDERDVVDRWASLLGVVPERRDDLEHGVALLELPR